MSIREELLKIGFSKEYINQVAKDAYQRRIKPKKKFLDTKLGRIISFDIAEYLIHHYSLKLYEKQRRKESEIKRKELEKGGFQGDKNNGIEVLEYEQAIGKSPINSVKNEDGSYTYTYQDGLQIKVNVTLSSFMTDKSLEEVEIRNKRLIADYLGLEEASIISMDYDKIDQLIEYNEGLERKKKKNSFHVSNQKKLIYKLKQRQAKLVKK